MAVAIREILSTGEERLFAIVLGSLFFILSISAIFFLQSQIRHNQVLMEYEADTISSALLESFRSDSQYPDLGDILETVTGFGVYDSRGDAIYISGTAPSTIGADNIPASLLQGDPRFTIDRKTATISIARSVGIRNSMMPMRGMMPRMAGLPMFVFTQIRIERHLLMKRIYTAAYLLVPLLIGLVLYFIGRLYYRNRLFSRRLEAQQNLVRLGEAARTLSHEIKNPLSAIRVQAAILKKLSPEEVYEDISVIEEEVDRMQRLVDRIGEFLRDPVGSPERIEIDIFIEALIKRYPGRVEFRHRDDDAIVVFDRERLRSVLENLITNALEATDPRRPHSPDTSVASSRIDVYADKLEATVCIAVVDNGPGLSEDQMRNIFDPFYTTKSKGSGIGLAIAKRFTESAGGTLELVPGNPDGTEARVVLPLADAISAGDTPG